MAIHLIQRSAGWAACQSSCADGDVVVLLGEGVCAVLTGADNCYAVNTDVAARGLVAHLPAGVEQISDAQLVELCAQHKPIVTWTRA